MESASPQSGRWRAGAILGLVTVLAAVALGTTLWRYGSWLTGERSYPQMDAAGAARLLAGPVAGRLGTTVALLEADADLIYIADGMRDGDWMAAYYLYPRRLHVRPSHVLDDTEQRTRLASNANMVLVGDRLLRLPELTPVSPPAPSSDWLPEEVSPRGWLAFLLTAVAAIGWGAGCLRLTAPALPTAGGLSGRLGLSLAIGLGLSGATGFAAALANLAALPVVVWSWHLVGVALALTAGGWLRHGDGGAPAAGATDTGDVPSPADTRPGQPGALAQRLLLAAVLLLAALPLVRAAGEPMLHWDERFQWAYKGKILLHEGGIGGPTFTRPDRPHLHRHYPLLLPALEARTARLAGGFSQERSVKLLFPLFFAALLLLGHACFRSRLSATPALLWTLLLAALPPFHHATRVQGGPAHTGFADLPLAVFVGAALYLLIPWCRRLAAGGSSPPARLGRSFLTLGLVAGFAHLTKPEGVAVLVTVLTILGLEGWRRRRNGGGTAVLVAIAAAVILMLPRLALGEMVPDAGTVGYSGDADYLSRLDGASLASGLKTNLLPALTGMAGALFSPRWAFLGLLIVAGLAAGVMGRRHRRHTLALLVLIPLAADLVAYTLTGSEIRWHLAVSVDRLWMQLLLPLLFIAAGQLAALAEISGAEPD